MIKAVIFDMDGVILDSEPFWKEAEIKIFNSLGVPLTDAMCETTTGMRLVDVIKLWHEKYPWDIKKDPFDKVNKKIVESLIELIKQKSVLNTGVLDLLEMFRSKGLPLAIASSSDQKIIDTVIEKFELRKYFKVIHSAEFEDYGKPHPAIYITTAKKLGVKPNECLAIEDSFNGVVAAIAARMKTAAYPEKTNFYNPNFAIADVKFRTLKDFTIDEFNKLNIQSYLFFEIASTAKAVSQNNIPEKSMLIVVAGPYNAETEEQKAANLRAMNIAAAAVYRKGHIPVIGVNASLYVADELPDIERKKVIADISYAIVERCDAILMIGSSPGADCERDLISSQGLPVYNSIDEIPEIK